MGQWEAGQWEAGLSLSSAPHQPSSLPSSMGMGDAEPLTMLVPVFTVGCCVGIGKLHSSFFFPSFLFFPGVCGFSWPEVPA